MLRYYPNMTVLEAQRVTLAEFEVMSEAHMLRKIDEQFVIYSQAWAIVQAQATDKHGKPVYKNFNKFFDYEKMLKQAKGDEINLQNKNTNINFYKELSRLNKAGD